MLYQNILGERALYQAFVSGMGGFSAHRHADLEFSYCLSGEFTVLIEHHPYTVRAGELLLAAPMTLHEIPPSCDPTRRVLTVVLGPALLREDFAPFADCTFRHPVLRPEETANGEAFTAALSRAAALAGSTAHADRLALLSDIFEVASCLAAMLAEERAHPMGDLRGVAGIEPALELIWHSYRAPLTVEEAAAVTGYGKSNFCKIFRTVTGETFHRALNNRRIGIARDLLRTTDLPIAAVGAEVGLPEAKTFSRVFRELEGMTPGDYRRRHAHP